MFPGDRLKWIVKEQNISRCDFAKRKRNGTSEDCCDILTDKSSP